MPHLKLALLIGLLLTAISGWAQPATTYPARLGAVNDYAGKLDQAQVNELTGLIKHYQRQTTIEFVVVVVDSLEGQSARAYASGLGDAWGVGGAVGRNNGVVFLWAPTERAYALRIANGLSPDLSDADAIRITTQHLLPDFKSGDYYAGVKKTILATMTHLGNKSWADRLQARSQTAALERLVQQQRAEQEREAEIQREREQAQRAEEEKLAQQELNRVLLGFVIVVALIVVIGIGLSRSRRRKSRRVELAQADARIMDCLSTAEKNAPQIQALLDEFARETPEQDISALRDELAGQPDRILKIKVDFQCLNLADLQSYDEMVRVRTRAENETDLLESIKQRIAEIKEAKAQSQALMANLARENFEISQVRDRSKIDEINRLLAQSRQEYQQARQNSSMSVVDWLLINNLLNSSHAQVQQAVQYSQQEPYVPPPTYSNDSRSSSSFFGGSSSSSSGSSYSSSSSGGGSGFSSGGSGSDGTY
jgi:uncharacterized membrane protein YgcG